MSTSTIRPRERDSIIQSLRAGVVPRTGLQYIQVGRVKEVKSVLADIDRICDGGTAFRLVIGEYGSGKTFFLSLVRSMALARTLVTAHADLSPERRLHSTGGQGRSLYTELMRNLSTRARPEGNALSGVLEKFVSTAEDEARAENCQIDDIVATRLRSLRDLVGGYDFATVIERYTDGFTSGNDSLVRDSERWLRGEFLTKTDARNALGVRAIIDDGNIYDYLKLLARLLRLSGYGGLLVTLDEMVNLYKLGNSQARCSNYEEILRVLNDSLQGSTEGIGFLMSGTPEFLMDPRRGLYSYQALASRLAENGFAFSGLSDDSGPVLRLKGLSPEDLFVLLMNLRNVFAGGDPGKYLVPDGALRAFMAHCSKKIGDSYFRTPRTTVTAFLDLLAVLEQHPEAGWTDLIDSLSVVKDADTDPTSESDDDGLATIRL